MKQFSRTLSLLSLLALFVAFTGCADDANPTAGGDDDVSGSESLETIDLDEEYGGLAYSDEAEAFGDDVLMSAATIEDQAALSEDEEDSLLDDDPSLDGPSMRRTYVRILWGQLGGAFDRESASSAEITPVDWTGSIKVTEGVVALKRTILFERPFDHRLPRVSRDSLAWKSQTGPHFDGVLVAVMSPVEDGVAQGELILETPQFRTRLTIDTLDGYDEITVVDALGNAVSIRAEVHEQQACAAGFLAGFWKGIEDRPETDAIEMGVFRGRYVGQNGLTTGFLKGVYGLNSAGERVMIGKYVGRNGRVKGLIRGTWSPDGEADGMGTFEARWVNRNGVRMGVLGGNYQENHADEIGDGFFEGRYREICSSAS